MTRSRRSRGALASAVGLMFALVLAGIVGPVGDAGASTASNAPIPLGSVGSYTEPGTATGLPGEAPIKAWADWVNAHGGINGHPVKLFVMDDQGNQAVAVSDVEQLVQQDHVIAFVSEQDGSLVSGYQSYLDAQKIPVLGGNVYEPSPWDNDPMFYPQGTTLVNGLEAGTTYAKKEGYKKFGSLACAEAAQCAQGNAALKSLATSAGLTYAYGAVASSTAPDYTANCLAAQQAGVQILELLIPTASEGTKIAEDCARQNYHPAWIIPGEAIGPGYLTTSSFNHTFSGAVTQPWFSKAPVMANFDAAMKKYTKINLNTVEEPLLATDAWASGLMLQEAVKLSGTTGLPTSADILAGLAKFDNQTLGGFGSPTTFTDPTNKVGACFYVVQIKNQKFVEGNNDKYLCNAS